MVKYSGHNIIRVMSHTTGQNSRLYPDEPYLVFTGTALIQQTRYNEAAVSRLMVGGPWTRAIWMHIFISLTLRKC